MSDMKELSARINNSFNDAERAGDSASYQRLANILSQSEVKLREYIQDITKV